MTNLDPHAPPEPTAGRILNEDQWLHEMSQWTEGLLRGVVTDSTAPSAAKMAARQRLAAMDGTLDRSGKPMNGQAFDRVTARTLGKPKEDPKVVINQNTLNVGTDHIFNTLDAFLAEKSPQADLRLDAPESVERSHHGPPNSEGTARECDGSSEVDGRCEPEHPAST